jgi:hypothetical protein
LRKPQSINQKTRTGNIARKFAGKLLARFARFRAIAIINLQFAFICAMISLVGLLWFCHCNNKNNSPTQLFLLLRCHGGSAQAVALLRGMFRQINRKKTK